MQVMGRCAWQAAGAGGGQGRGVGQHHGHAPICAGQRRGQRLPRPPHCPLRGATSLPVEGQCTAVHPATLSCLRKCWHGSICQPIFARLQLVQHAVLLSQMQVVTCASLRADSNQE